MPSVGVSRSTDDRIARVLRGEVVRAGTDADAGGSAVELVLDAQERDRFGRVLAYVYRVSDGRFVNDVGRRPARTTRRW
jgi:hypothetical protein